MQRRGFTLIEMMIAIVIFSIVMLYLYESNANLRRSNIFYEKEVSKLKHEELKKKVLFLDFSLMRYKSIQILNQDKHEDVVFMQSSNSIHGRSNPYIAYIIKNQKLYRLESFKKLSEYPLPADSEFDADLIGEVNGFRVYKNQKQNKAQDSVYLIHVNFKNAEPILLKVKALNEY